MFLYLYISNYIPFIIFRKFLILFFLENYFSRIYYRLILKIKKIFIPYSFYIFIYIIYIFIVIDDDSF